MATDDKCVTLNAYFKISSEKTQECKALCEQAVAKSKAERGCLYYGFSFDADQMFCREGYRDADGALVHLHNVGALLGELLKIAEVTRFELHGPAAELDKLRGRLRPNTSWWLENPLARF